MTIKSTVCEVLMLINTLRKFILLGRMTVHWVLFSVEMLGILVLNSVTLAVIANYVTHCEMVLFYLRGLALRLQEKSTELKAAMKVSPLFRNTVKPLSSCQSSPSLYGKHNYK